MDQFISGIPPRCSGSYRIRNEEGLIILWGDSKDLYCTWSAYLEAGLIAYDNCFEYML